MSLVAYETSSEEESDNEDCKNLTDEREDVGTPANRTEVLKDSSQKENRLSLPPPKEIDSTEFAKSENEATNGGNISDDEEYYPENRSGPQVQENSSGPASTNKEVNPISFAKLPAPKVMTLSAEIEEEDDEFLHKTAEPPQIEKPSISSKVPVKITIPSLSEFKDLEKDNEKKAKIDIGPSPKTCGLLNLLPKPKYEQVFVKTNDSQATNQVVKTTSLIPDSVKNRQAQINKVLQNPQGPQVKKSLVADFSDSEGSENEEDFFSLNSKQELPEVSLNEINSMVAKQAAKMAETTNKFDEMFAHKDKQEEMPPENVQEEVQEEINFDEKALHALVGSRAKRRKVEVNVVELSSEQVLPNKDEWLRTALAQATTYQPKGVLVDEEPAPGTRKKHQITYLAHQAKANEQELQAMWAANRHTRRQTQSKYGF